MRFIIAGSILCLAATAHANGFVLNDHGAKATGRAGAVVATVTDGSAVVHNPGGLAVEEGTHVYLGATLLMPNAAFTEASTGTRTETTSGSAVTPNLYLISRVHDLVSAGIGFHTPFGSRITWPHESPGADEVTNQALRSYFITPVVGLNLDRFVSGLTIGGGLDIVPATVELEQDIWFGEDTGTGHLGGNAMGIGGRIGLMYRPSFLPKLQLGASWRSQVTLDSKAPAISTPRLRIELRCHLMAISQPVSRCHSRFLAASRICPTTSWSWRSMPSGCSGRLSIN